MPTGYTAGSAQFCLAFMVASMPELVLFQEARDFIGRLTHFQRLLCLARLDLILGEDTWRRAVSNVPVQWTEILFGQERRFRMPAPGEVKHYYACRPDSQTIRLSQAGMSWIPACEISSRKLADGYTSDDATNGKIVGTNAAEFIKANLTGPIKWRRYSLGNVGRRDFYGCDW